MRMIRTIVRLALLGFAALILFASLAPASARAAVPEKGGFDHFVDCAWLIITDGDAHHIHCGPNHVTLDPGFPGTGVTISTPSTVTQQPAGPTPSCCSCSGASIDIEMGALLAAADETLSVGPTDPLQQFLLACCPCNSGGP